MYLVELSQLTLIIAKRIEKLSGGGLSLPKHRAALACVLFKILVQAREHNKSVKSTVYLFSSQELREKYSNQAILDSLVELGFLTRVSETKLEAEYKIEDGEIIEFLDLPGGSSSETKTLMDRIDATLARGEFRRPSIKIKNSETMAADSTEIVLDALIRTQGLLSFSNHSVISLASLADLLGIRPRAVKNRIQAKSGVITFTSGCSLRLLAKLPSIASLVPEKKGGSIYVISSSNYDYLRLEMLHQLTTKQGSPSVSLLTIFKLASQIENANTTNETGRLLVQVLSALIYDPQMVSQCLNAMLIRSLIVFVEGSPQESVGANALEMQEAILLKLIPSLMKEKPSEHIQTDSKRYKLLMITIQTALRELAKFVMSDHKLRSDQSLKAVVPRYPNGGLELFISVQDQQN